MTEELGEMARDVERHFCRRPAPASVRARTWARLHGGRRRTRLRTWVRAAPVIVAAGLAAALVFIMTGATRPPIVVSVMVGLSSVALGPPPGRPPVVSPSVTCALERDPGHIVLEGPCSVGLDQPSMTMTSWGKSTVTIDQSVVSLEEGWVLFDVDPVVEGPPVRIEVGAGTIEVLGTRFAVYADQARGHVELVEGKIRIVDRTGATTVLEAGERYAWTAVGSSSAPLRTSPDPVGESASRRRDVEPAGSIDEIARLRALGQYREALTLAKRLAARATDRRKAEVLDYEAGTIIEDSLGDDERACRHWNGHERRFPRGRYRDEVRRRREQLDCAGSGH